MKIRGLLVAVAVLAFLFGLLYWSNRAEDARQGEPDPDAPPKILELEKDTLVKVSIRTAVQEAVVLEKGESGEWALTAPEAMGADQSAADTLLSTLASLDSDRLVEEGSEGLDLESFGLGAPQLEVEITDQEGGAKRLMVGDETPTGSNYFAKVDGDPRIFTLASFNKTSIEKTPWDLRDKRLLTFDSDSLTGVELTAKDQTTEVGKNNSGQWQIVRPRPLRADGGAVEQVISHLRDARMDTEPTPDLSQEASASFSSATRVATANVTDAAGTQEIEVRRASDGDYYARSSVVEGIHKITTSVGEGLDKGLEDLRNRKLFDFGWTEPNRIEIRDGDQAAAYEMTDGTWMRDGRPVDAVSLRSMLDKLRDLSAASFSDSGLTDPIFEATVVWEGNAERVLISRSGDDYFARREDEPAIYELDGTAVEEIQTSARNIQDSQSEETEDETE